MPELLTGLVSGTRLEAIKAEPVCYPHGCQQPLATHSRHCPDEPEQVRSPVFPGQRFHTAPSG
mgnify:CR=1 FL=1